MRTCLPRLAARYSSMQLCCSCGKRLSVRGGYAATRSVFDLRPSIHYRTAVIILIFAPFVRLTFSSNRPTPERAFQLYHARYDGGCQPDAYGVAKGNVCRAAPRTSAGQLSQPFCARE